MKKSCKTCKYWDRDKARSESGRIMNNRVAACECPIPPLPDAFSKGMSRQMFRKVTLSWMCATDGKDCQTYEKRIELK